MNEIERDASELVAAGLSAMGVGSSALRDADAALAVKPTAASNARWFVRMFVLPRRSAGVNAVELFWTNLEIARDRFAECEVAISDLFEQHSSLAAVWRLQEELGAAGYDGIAAALKEDVAAGEEAAASLQLQPFVARMRICETRMVAAIQALAAAE